MWTDISVDNVTYENKTLKTGESAEYACSGSGTPEPLWYWIWTPKPKVSHVVLATSNIYSK